MRRREFIAGLGSAAAWPLAALAQQPALPVIGYLGAQSADDDYKNITVPFLQGLKETGFVEGQHAAAHRGEDACKIRGDRRFADAALLTEYPNDHRPDSRFGGFPTIRFHVYMIR
jgi:hypothetical protein